MKAALFLTLALGLGAQCSLFAASAVALVPGLVVTEYPRHASQADDKNSFALPLDQLGEPVGRKFIVESLSPWKWETERNAVARGVLEIEADGDYRFTTSSFYDRNLLMIDDKIVCAVGDGDQTVATIPLKKGSVSIVSAGFVGGRGASGIQVRWQPPGQRELSVIPPQRLKHIDDGTARIATKPAKRPLPKGILATYLITVADDFIVEAYKNGVRIRDEQRRLVDEIHGATAERITIDVKAGDWLVFHVVNNHLRWGGAKYFSVAGCLDDNDYGFVTDPSSSDWSVCDDPSRARDFIRQRDEGTESRAGAIAKPWSDGDATMLKHAGAGFPGKPLWGGGSSTWIKFVSSKSQSKPVTLPSRESTQPLEEIEPLKPKPPVPAPCAKAVLSPTRWPVQILYGMWGSGDRNADVTLRLKELVEKQKTAFAVNPATLAADPIPYWRKSLWIAFVKDGVRHEVRRYEDEVVPPEYFYGPQSTSELDKWLPGSRWQSDKGELQFYPDHTTFGYPFGGTPQWEALASNKIRIHWADERKVEYLFDETWSSFHEVDNDKAVFHVVENEPCPPGKALTPKHRD